MYKRYRLKMFFIMAAMSSMTGCVTETIERSPGMKFSDTAVISVQDPGRVIAQQSTFAWLPEAVRFYEDNRLETAPLKEVINDEIVKNLQAKQMTFVSAAESPEYSIAYTAALESSLDDDAIIKRYGLLPGNTQVPTDDNNIEKGSLIIYVFDDRTNTIVWRAAAQVGVKFDSSIDDRKQRLMKVIGEMFQSFPAR